MKDRITVKGQFQWKATIRINATPKRVWEIVDDISLIPQYHPEVGKVDLLSGQSKRAVGVKYQCNILEGRKGSCVEEVVEYIPNHKLSTAMPEDTWGLSEMFADFIVDTTVLPQGDNSAILQFEAYYNPVALKNKLLNVLLLRRVMRKRAVKTMGGIKRLAEKQ
jgi:hypothetical protein